MKQKGFAPILLVVILSVVFVGIYLQSRPSTIVVNKPARTPAPIDYDIVTYKGEEIHVAIGAEDPRIPRDVKIKDLNISWEDNNVVFTVDEAYFVPYFTSTGPDQRRTKPNYYVVFKVDERDRRIAGERQLPANCSSYFRLRKDGKDTAPIDNGCVALLPQENATYYIGFEVGKDNPITTYLVGKFTSPRLLTLDFTKSDVQIKKGLVLVNKGFVEDYPGNFK